MRPARLVEMSVRVDYRMDYPKAKNGPLGCSFLLVVAHGGLASITVSTPYLLKISHVCPPVLMGANDAPVAQMDRGGTDFWRNLTVGLDQ